MNTARPCSPMTSAGKPTAFSHTTVATTDAKRRERGHRPPHNIHSLFLLPLLSLLPLPLSLSLLSLPLSLPLPLPPFSSFSFSFSFSSFSSFLFFLFLWCCSNPDWRVFTIIGRYVLSCDSCDGLRDSASDRPQWHGVLW